MKGGEVIEKAKVGRGYSTNRRESPLRSRSGCSRRDGISNVCEHGDHPAPEGLRFCSVECERCEHLSEGSEGCDRLCVRTAPLSVLFFSDQGCGPDNVTLQLQPVRAIVDNGEVIAPPTLGLCVLAGSDPLRMYAALGGYYLSRDQVCELRDQLSAWIGGPEASRGGR